MERRRDFFQGLLARLGAPLLVNGADADAGESPPIGPLAAAEGVPGTAAPKTGSDVGSLWPFLRGQAVRGEFPLSYLSDEFGDLPAWKRRARGELLDRLLPTKSHNVRSTISPHREF